jgi:hypothetical protein
MLGRAKATMPSRQADLDLNKKSACRKKQSKRPGSNALHCGCHSAARMLGLRELGDNRCRLPSCLSGSHVGNVNNGILEAVAIEDFTARASRNIERAVGL